MPLEIAAAVEINEKKMLPFILTEEKKMPGKLIYSFCAAAIESRAAIFYTIRLLQQQLQHRLYTIGAK